MTSLDDQLQELFRTTSTPVDHQRGDIWSVRANVRRRQLRKRASVVLAAASFAAVAGAALGSRGGEHGRVNAGNDASTTEHPATTTSSPPATTNSVPPPPPSVRDVDFGAMTYPAPCPAFDDSPMTLSDGEGENVIDDGASVQAMLGNVAYGDANGDGVEEAVVLVQCRWVGANSDTGLLVAVFGAGADGGAEQIGEALTLEHWQESSLDGLDLHVLLDVYDDDDPMCCPSSQSQEVWRFDGTAFQRVSHQSLPRPPSE